MNLEEAKNYKDKNKDKNRCYLDRYLEFIYDGIKSCIDCDRNSCTVRFILPEAIIDGLYGITLVVDDGTMTDDWLTRSGVADIVKDIESQGYDIDITVVGTDDSYTIDLDEFTECFETLDVENKFFVDTRYFELEISGW